MRRTFIKLLTTFHMSESLKLHIIFSHYVEYFELTGHTLLKYTDEVTEAVHSQLRMFEERHQYKRNIKESTGHAIAQHNCTVFFNSAVALGDLWIKFPLNFWRFQDIRVSLDVIRFAKCHRYGRYICVKILESWGKKCRRPRSFVKQSIFGVNFTNFDVFLSLPSHIWYFLPHEVAIYLNSLNLSVKFVAICALFMG